MIPNIRDIRLLIFDFDGVFTNNKVMVDENGLESVICDRSDGLSIDWLNLYKQRGDLDAEFIIISQETNIVVAKRAIKLNIPYIHSASNKYDILKSHYKISEEEYKSLLKKTIYLGNDVNDLRMMKEVGYAVAPSDAHYLVRKYADLVLNEKGGEGFVRKFVEILLGITEMSHEQVISNLLSKS